MLCVAAGVAGGCGRPVRPSSDYERDVAALARQLTRERDGGGGDREGGGARIARAVLLQRRWALTGDTDDLIGASRLLDQVRAAGGASPALWLLSAMVALDSHRVGDARRLLGGVVDRGEGDGDADADDGGDGALVLLVKGDVTLQEGRLDQAEATYAQALGRRRAWDGLVRMAHLRAVRGDTVGADRLYAEAEDQLDTSQMRTFAWLEVQRGRLDFGHGRLEAARDRYQRAARAYSGYWLVDSRLAEVTAAMGQIPEAIAAYEELTARVANPEIAQALGDLYDFAGRTAQARPHHDRALGAYRRSVERGEVHYLHQLAAFQADRLDDAAAAVGWAERDLALRPGAAAAHDLMAWAFFRAGRIADAGREMAIALSAAAWDSHVLYHAAVITAAAGHPDQSARLLQDLAAINPAYQTTFHAHN